MKTELIDPNVVVHPVKEIYNFLQPIKFIKCRQSLFSTISKSSKRMPLEE